MPRFPRPFYRAAKRKWYVWLFGSQRALPVTDPKDFAGAMAAVMELAKRLNDPDAPKERAGTVRELVPVYLAEAAGWLRPKTVVDVKGFLGWFAARWGHLKPNDLDPERVEKAAGAAGWKRNSVRRVLSSVQAFVRWTGRTRFKLRKPQPQYRGTECVVPEADFRKILAAAEGDYAPYLRLLWLTGCRPGEGRAATAAAVDWSAGTITLAEHKTSGKTGEPRTIFLPGEAVDLLRAQAAKWPTGVLFRGRYRQPLSLAGVRVRWVTCCRLAGVRWPTIYGLRHAFAVRSLEAGLSSYEVATLLGHTSSSMVEKVYGHLGSNGKRLRALAERVNRAG